MKPVVTALHAIAAIECETREAQKEAASAGRSETILSRDLSQSSLASGNDRHGPDAPFAYCEAIPQLNRDPGTPPIAHLEATEPVAACAWDGQIRIETQDRIVVTPARNIPAIVTGALLSALAASLPVKTVNSISRRSPRCGQIGATGIGEHNYHGP
jgi:hypothetical protein